MLRVAAAGAELPPASLLDTVASPLNGGTTTGDGSYAPAKNVTVVATASPGFHFVNWSDNGKVVSLSSSYSFAIDINSTLALSGLSPHTTYHFRTQAENSKGINQGSDFSFTTPSMR